MQARAAAGEQSVGMLTVFRNVHAEYGMQGLFQVILALALALIPNPNLSTMVRHPGALAQAATAAVRFAHKA